MLIMGQSNGNFMIKDILFVFGGESTAVEIRETVDRYCSYRKVYNILPDDKSKNDKSLNDRDILSFSELEYVCYIMGFTNVNLKKRIITYTYSLKKNQRENVLVRYPRS